MRAFAGWCADDGRPIDAAGDRFRSFETLRYPLMNAGTWLCLAGGSAALLAIAIFRSRRDETWLRTPRSPGAFFAVGLGALLATWAGTIVGIQIDQHRYAFPACADSIIIGMIGLTIGTLLLTVILIVVGFIVSRAFGTLPVSLMCWDVDRPTRSWIVTLLLAAAMLTGLLLAVANAIAADFLTAPAAVTSLYLLAATRAALLAPKSAVSSQAARTVGR